MKRINILLVLLAILFTIFSCDDEEEKIEKEEVNVYYDLERLESLYINDASSTETVVDIEYILYFDWSNLPSDATELYFDSISFIQNISAKNNVDIEWEKVIFKNQNYESVEIMPDSSSGGSFVKVYYPMFKDLRISLNPQTDTELRIKFSFPISWDSREDSWIILIAAYQLEIGLDNPKYQLKLLPNIDLGKEGATGIYGLSREEDKTLAIIKR